MNYIIIIHVGATIVPQFISNKFKDMESVMSVGRQLKLFIILLQTEMIPNVVDLLCKLQNKVVSTSFMLHILRILNLKGNACVPIKVIFMMTKAIQKVLQTLDIWHTKNLFNLHLLQFTSGSFSLISKTLGPHAGFLTELVLSIYKLW